MPDTLASHKTAATPGPPIAMSDAELERLLDEATSLSRELAEEAGVLEGSAVQPADAAAMEPPDRAASATEQAKPLPDLLQDPDSPTAAARTKAGPEPTTNIDAASQAGDPPAGRKRSVKIETRDEQLAENASVESGAEESGEGEDAAGEEGRPRGLSVKERLAASYGLAARWGRAVPIGVANGGLSIFVALDRPFHDVTPGMKRALGMLALATLLAGIIIWILPSIMNDNPFAQMERYTKIRR